MSFRFFRIFYDVIHVVFNSFPIHYFLWVIHYLKYFSILTSNRMCYAHVCSIFYIYGILVVYLLVIRASIEVLRNINICQI